MPRGEGWHPPILCLQTWVSADTSFTMIWWISTVFCSKILFLFDSWHPNPVCSKSGIRRTSPQHPEYRLKWPGTWRTLRDSNCMYILHTTCMFPDKLWYYYCYSIKSDVFGFERKPYSTDLAQLVFVIFPNLKSYLRGKRFNHITKISHAIQKCNR